MAPTTDNRVVVLVWWIASLFACGCAIASAPSTSLDAGPETGLGADASLSDCLPVSATEQACNGLDDDCNGVVDDVDVGNDGFCDCYTVGIIGNPGPTASSDFDAWLEKNGTAVTRIGTDASHVLTADQLALFDVVILDQLTHRYSAAEAELVRGYVESGHGLITLAGYVNDALDRDNQSSLTRAVGVQLVGPIYNDPTRVWNSHPLTEGVGPVQFYGGWAVEAIGAEPLGDVLLSATSDSAALAVAKTYGEGRAFVYGDEWISLDAEWQSVPGMTTLWQNVLRWVGPKSVCFPDR